MFDGSIDLWIVDSIDQWFDRSLVRWFDRSMDHWIDRSLVRWIDRLLLRCMDGLIDRCIFGDLWRPLLEDSLNLLGTTPQDEVRVASHHFSESFQVRVARVFVITWYIYLPCFVINSRVFALFAWRKV